MADIVAPYAVGVHSAYHDVAHQNGEFDAAGPQTFSAMERWLAERPRDASFHNMEYVKQIGPDKNHELLSYRHEVAYEDQKQTSAEESNGTEQWSWELVEGTII